MRSNRQLSTIAAGAALAILFGVAGQAKADFINGGFETGDFSGWTTSNLNFTGVGGSGTAGYATHSGNFFAYLGNVGSDGFLSQTLTTVSGQAYVLSLFLASNGTSNDFGVSVNGNFVFPTQYVPNTGSQYIHLTFNVVGTGSDTITFNERDDPNYLALDDVSLTPSGASATPEPASVALLGIGAMSLLGYGWRRRKTVAPAAA